MRKIGRLLIAVITLAAVSSLAQAASLEDVKTRIHKDGSGTWMRQQFPKDIEPIALIPGGGGNPGGPIFEEG